MIAKIGQTLSIGACSEHNARAYEFDVAKWRRMWPGATAIDVIVQRPGDKTAYPAVSSVDGDTVTWTVTRYDTERPGAGEMWVAFVSGDKLLGLTPVTAIIVQEGPDMGSGDTPASETPPWIQRVLDAIAGFKPGEGGGNGTPGKDGEDGATFTPHVSADGTLSWTNNGGLENPEPVNIKGKDGDPGVVISDTEPTDPDVQVWINPDSEPDDAVETDKTLSMEGVPADAKATGERLNSLNEDIAKQERQCYVLSDMPMYLGKQHGKNNPYGPVEILDFDGFGLCALYNAKKEMYSLDPASLTLTKLCDMVYSSEENPNWYCAKILPTWGTKDKDKVLLWDRKTQAVYLGATSGTILTRFQSQKLGWLRNQGIDITLNANGYNSGTMIYAEYYLPDFGVDVDTVKVYRSTDLGQTWTAVFEQKCRHNASGGEVFHFHYVRQDPYNPGHWYLGSGDQKEECNMWRSVDDGLTWTKINDPNFTGNLQPIHRTCDLYFTEDCIYWGTDDHMEYLEGFKDAVWCKSPRNLDTNQLSIEVLADLEDQVRLTIQTPYGVMLATEKKTHNNSWVWLAPYDDLDHPVLVCKHHESFGNQVQQHSYGSRFFSAAQHTDDYPRTNTEAWLHVHDISRMSRLD